MKIDGVEFPNEVVAAFCEVFDEPLSFFLDEKIPRWYRILMVGHLESFHCGWKAGFEAASAECPNCEECDVHSKAAERGPPESHYSHQDR